MRALPLLLLLPLSALAQEETAPSDERAVRYAEVTEHTFLGAEVQAGVVRPKGVVVQERRPARFPSLIELRDDFADAMSASVDQVK